uniref:NAD(P)(+)--arginine ADP-ribosyltransferase n=1 Tax=Geospiza parvula TaxID=87175 RepID=A0A8U8CBA0_GEOPR
MGNGTGFGTWVGERDVPHCSWWPVPTMALLAHTLALLAMVVATVAIKVVPLDMAWDSFDDQYQGCGPAMHAKLPDLYSFERQMNHLFAWGWYRADAEWRRRGSPVSPLTSHWQAIALMAYTSPEVYKEFNAAVRTGWALPPGIPEQLPLQNVAFSADRCLGDTEEGSERAKCHRVFRGVHDIHFQAWQGQRVRFGQFTSTSLSKGIALQFGADTIFEVHTCHGADIRQFSTYPGEEEVLIPPFETFTVTRVISDGRRTWIWLRSAGTFSKYNCQVSEVTAEGTTWGDGDIHCGPGDTHDKAQGTMILTGHVGQGHPLCFGGEGHPELATSNLGAAIAGRRARTSMTVHRDGDSHFWEGTGTGTALPGEGRDWALPVPNLSLPAKTVLFGWALCAGCRWAMTHHGTP